MLDFIEKHSRLFSSAALLIMTGIEFGVINKMYKDQNKETNKIYRETLQGNSNQEEES